jgi:histone acetyltransferase (RNA polymerase elongator complex component)
LRSLRSLPFFFAMAGCSRRCIYCDQKQITGESAAPTPCEIRNILQGLEEPVEISFFGGSFTCLPPEEIDSYMEAAGTAPRGSTLRFSTHPLCISREILARLKNATGESCPLACVELGISSLDDGVLKACARGYSGDEALQALDLMVQEGLPPGAQLMIGLPGQDEASTLDDLRRLAKVKGPRSMDLRIYPCLVLAGTPLEDLWASGRYTPLETGHAARWAGRLLLEALDLGFNVLRVGLAETPSLSASVKSGPHHPAFGELAWGDCLARLLTRNSSSGPWVEHRDRRSFFSGHGKWGLKRLSALSQGSEADTKSALEFWPPEASTRRDSHE